jgi:NAD(P)-dependent dehydrogenase (short-subunit alcohol dehydrogenase family)
MSDAMAGKVCVITGANTGIGRATAEALARRGATVVMVCRNRERADAARKEIAAATKNDSVELVVADLSEMAQVRRAASDIAAMHPKVDVLINNAAVFLPRREETGEGLEKTFATNYLSHFLLTHLLLPNLKAAAPSRIINVATLTRGLKIDLDDLQLKKGYSVMGSVGPTKLALIFFTQELARRLEGSGVTVNALHPGLIKTPLLDDVPWWMRAMFHLMSKPPEKGAQTPVYLATSGEVQNVSGKLFADCKPVKVTGPATDVALQTRLWELSAALARVPA